jgi:hypothetical protein
MTDSTKATTEMEDQAARILLRLESRMKITGDRFNDVTIGGIRIKGEVPADPQSAPELRGIIQAMQVLCGHIDSPRLGGDLLTFSAKRGEDGAWNLECHADTPDRIIPALRGIGISIYTGHAVAPSPSR